MRIALNFRRIDPTKGGAETYVVDLIHRLVRAGHEVAVYAESCRGGLLPPGATFHPIAAPGWFRPQQTWNFARNSERALIRAEAADQFDVSLGLINTWHHDVLIPQGGVHGASLDFNARRFAAGCRRGLYRLGKRINPKSWVYAAIEARQYDPHTGAKRVVAVSSMVRGHLEHYHGVAPDRITVIPNAIDAGRLLMDDPAGARASLRAELGLAADATLGLFVGHNYELKGLRPLLRGLRHRLDRDPRAKPIHLLACGGGKPQAFQALTRRLGLEAVVHFLGFQPDIRPCFHASDFFASPTYYDPCSLVVFEALACGLPVITTACNGAGEQVTPGREGFVVPHPDALGPLADALDRMTDRPTRRRMADAAIRLGLEQSMDRHVTRLIAVLGQVAETRQARRGTLRPHIGSLATDGPRMKHGSDKIC